MANSDKQNKRHSKPPSEFGRRIRGDTSKVLISINGAPSLPPTIREYCERCQDHTKANLIRESVSPGNKKIETEYLCGSCNSYRLRIEFNKHTHFPPIDVMLARRRIPLNP